MFFKIVVVMICTRSTLRHYVIGAFVLKSQPPKTNQNARFTLSFV